MINDPSSPESSPSSEHIQDLGASKDDLRAPIPRYFVGFGGELKQRHEGKPPTGYRPTDESINHQSTYPDQNYNGIPTRG